MYAGGMNPPVKLYQAEWLIKDGVVKIEKINPMKGDSKIFQGIKIGSIVKRYVGNKQRDFVLSRKSNPREKMTVFHFDEV